MGAGANCGGGVKLDIGIVANRRLIEEHFVGGLSMDANLNPLTLS